MLTESSAARRERAESVKKLEEAIKELGNEQVIERVAYIWFNRFCALRFMDVNRYNRVGIVSPADPGQFQPEILAEAKMRHIDEEMMPEKAQQQIFALLDGKAPSSDPQGEAYRLLVVAACNFWNKAMPFLFQRIDDYTELLMPDDLLSGNSTLAYIREAMTPDACEDVEVIGWLYQFYISEKKDEVFDGLKKNKKITPENIPAATQLFTPHWIVRYLVENSLGRLWLLNRPGSKLVEQMDYYIKPEQAETNFLRISKPEDIKVCDPACGSGHMLTYAFDLLYAIYEEEGYEPGEIPEKILTHNLYGIEIDERAGELAAFALTMKARGKQRRFFNKSVKPNICVLENIHFDESELKEYMDFIGRDLFSAPLLETLRQFEEADNFGSLIRPVVTDVRYILGLLEGKDVAGQILLYNAHKKVLRALRQAEYLGPKYHVVVANPPYMGGKGMNGRLGAWVKEEYPDSKSDLFAAFIERNLELAMKQGSVAMITMQSWMFLSSFEKLRSRILEQDTILAMAHLGARGFDSIGGEVVSTTAFVLENSHQPEYKGGYLRLVDGGSEAEKEGDIREAIKNPNCGWFFRASAADFKKIPGSPVAYWVSENIRDVFHYMKISSITISDGQTKTGDNDRFLRNLWEVNKSVCGVDLKWVKHPKGGAFRRWYGNVDFLIDWSESSRKHYRSDHVARILPEYLWWKKGFCWTLITSGKQSFRFVNNDEIFNLAAPTLFPKNEKDLLPILGLVNTPVTEYITKLMNPTINMNVGEVQGIPLVQINQAVVESIVGTLIRLSRVDWDAYETSWDFACLPLLHSDYRQPFLKATYQNLRTHWQEMTQEMQRLEEENNRIFIDAYGLQDELTPEVPLNEITLTCNPHYRYDHTKTATELEALLLADTMRELLSYAVGCMFGRYSLDKPGLLLANQGETIADYHAQIPTPSFPPDQDNVLPILDGDWFIDDISDRFRKFLRVTFGDQHYEENLKFIETALGKDIRKYFLKDFYNDHLKRYKKRPIYWLFSSPKGSFQALIYLHRYRPDTVSIVLNDYLREFSAKLNARVANLRRLEVSADASPAEKTKAIKEIEKLNKTIEELNDYEREVLYPLAIQQIQIDLDDGVKVNYQKFGAALKKIPGLETKEGD